MIDLHIHMLPGVDDGADSVEEALAMAEMAVQSGVSEAVVTPHANQSERFENFVSPRLRQRFWQLREALAAERLPLTVHLGMEIMASRDIGEKIRSGLLCGLAGTDYFLVEFPFDAPPHYMEEVLRQVQDAGKIPVIAHPERYFCLQSRPAYLYEWMREGVFSQLNRGSVLGRFGPAPRRAAQMFLEFQLVSWIASDAHSFYSRTPALDDVRDWLELHMGIDYAEAMLEKHPQAMLQGKEIPFYGERPLWHM